MRIVVKCNYHTKSATTQELIVNYMVGHLDGVNVKTRCVDENVTFTDIFFIINGQEINGKDIVSLKMYDRSGWHDVSIESARVAIDISSSYSYEDFAIYVGNMLVDPQE